MLVSLRCGLSERPLQCPKVNVYTQHTPCHKLGVSQVQIGFGAVLAVLGILLEYVATVVYRPFFFLSAPSSQ